ncbi:MAG: ABC transporter ATP-binding protein, partial [Clostridiales bacterium]|nr:ABC transporter ATP-binding protein [Clostridiales bacterium]
YVTLLLVTHQVGVAKQFCKRGMVIERGKKCFDGDMEGAVVEYNNILTKTK